MVIYYGLINVWEGGGGLDDLRIKVDMSKPTSAFCSRESEHLKSYTLFDLQWLNYKSYFIFSEFSEILFV